MRVRTRTLVIVIGRSLQQVTTLVLGVILVRLVSKEIFGTYRQVNLVYMFLAGFISLQLHSSLYYFLPKLGPGKRKQLVLQTMAGTLATSALVSLILLLGAEYISKLFSNPQLAILLRVFAILPIFERLIQLVNAFMISLDKPVRGTAYSLAASVFRIGIVVLLFASGYGLWNVVWGVVIVEAVVASTGCADMIRFCRTGAWAFNWKLTYEQFDYSWPLLATSVVGLLKVQLDKIFISSYFDPETYAVYSCGALQIPIVALITSSLAMAITPTMVEMLEQKKPLHALDIWNQSARKASLIIFPCFAFFLFFGYEVIVLLYGQEYSAASFPFRIYLFTLPLRVVIYSAFLRALGKTKPIAIAAFYALIINAVISLTLLLAGRGSTLSFVGPSIGTVIGEWFMFIFLLLAICRNANLTLRQVMRWKELSFILGLSLFCGLALWFIPVPLENLFLRLVVRFALYALLFFTSLVLTRSIHSDEWELLYLPLTFIRNSIKKKFKNYYKE